MSSSGSSIIPAYDPPALVESVGSLLAGLRGDATIVDFFSSDSDARSGYVNGLIYLSLIILAVIVIWSLILIALKIKGRESVGCASGHAFQTEDEKGTTPTSNKWALKNLPTGTGESGDSGDGGEGVEVDDYYNKPRRHNNHSHNNEHANNFVGDLDLALEEDYYHHHQQQQQQHDIYSPNLSTLGVLPTYSPSNHASPYDTATGDRHEGHLTFPPEQTYDPAYGKRSPPRNHHTNNQKHHEYPGTSALFSIPKEELSSLERNAIRQRRTRLAYWLFGIMTLFCCFLLFSQTYVPFRTAAAKTSEVSLDIQQIVGTVETDWIDLVEHANNAQDTIDNDLPTNFETLCPNVNPEILEAEFGVDLEEVVQFVKDEFTPITNSAEDRTAAIENALKEIKSNLADIDASIESADGSLWMIPFTAVCVIILTGVFLMGVLATQIRMSSPCTEGTLSCIFLPIFLFLTLVCWTYVAASMAGASVTYDVCVSAETPEQMIQEILRARNVDSDSMTHRLVTAYTTGCLVEDPIQPIEQLEEDLMVHIDMIRTQVLQADEVGIGVLQTRCGEQNKIDEFFVASRALEADLTVVHSSLDSISNALACSRINELYRQIFHDAICTEVASASASGFVLFLVVAICCSTLVSLRASWRR